MQPTTNTKQPDRPAQEPDSLPEQAESARILRRLADRVGPKNYENWFLGRCTVTIEGDEVRFGVGSPFVVSWMQRQFREAMQGTATDVLGPSARVRLDVDPNVMPEVVGDGGSTANKRTSAVGEGTGSENATPGGDRDSGAGGRRSGTRRRFADLGDFVVGDSNRLAWTAASRICDAPADGLSPLYLFGHVGVGKTHLLEGISRRIRRLYPSLRVTYLTAEMFTNYFTAALRERSTPGFRQRFRSIDVLLVDDVDFLDAKKGVQEEFLHTLKQLEANGSHVVLAANQHPRLLAKFSEELSSRLMAGLVCRIEPPELGTRQEIVGRLAKRMAVTFTPEALAVVARRFTHSVRELKGALYCLQNWSIASGRQRISARVSRRVLAELERDCIRIVALGDVERAICSLFGVQAAELKSSRRTRSLVQPRMLAMFLARKHTQAAYSEIGEFFGGRNHSTVMSAVAKVQDWLSTDTPVMVSSQSLSVQEVVDSVEQQLLAG
ncbi:MAG TPA: chromosomal replication initiator protein DnaA [Planctomycetaceae bacterium]|nr:chromosomal replication initiator protein DnaA [Planctomycetaceae bacterium]|tara:strand:- start:895 stop:2379 length:1485 start_codon:yes stop_codon:yes gene_type:complete